MAVKYPIEINFHVKFQCATNQPQAEGIPQRHPRDRKCRADERSSYLHMRRQKLSGLQR